MELTVQELGKRVKTASKQINIASSQQRNDLLAAIADHLRQKMDRVLAANEQDMADAEQNGVRPAMLDRLKLTAQRVEALADAVEDVIALPDPVGQVAGGMTRPNGLRITKTKVPFGVIAMIFEARPNVTVDAAVLCIKSGNACILRGGKEAIHSNRVLVEIMQEAVVSCGFSADILGLVQDTSRESASQLMKLNGLVDLLIPRGGAGLIQSVVQNATVPVIETGVGNCHIFVDESADIEMAVDILDNAKTQRPSTCNAVETVLVHEKIADRFLPAMKERLDQHKVELRGDEQTCGRLGETVLPATEEDYFAEYNDFILAVKVVKDLDEAIRHIDTYSTHHSEAIITNDYKHSQQFIAQVDAAAVYVNASTRFTDGGEFGFGAEIGISTQKLHARGPMGLEELTTTKYVILGDGQVR